MAVGGEWREVAGCFTPPYIYEYVLGPALDIHYSRSFNVSDGTHLVMFSQYVMESSMDYRVYCSVVLSLIL